MAVALKSGLDLESVVEQHLPLVKHVVFQVAVHFPRHVDREELARSLRTAQPELTPAMADALTAPLEPVREHRPDVALLDIEEAGVGRGVDDGVGAAARG